MIVKFIVALLAVAPVALACATDTDPLDFSYDVMASTADQPALIFNDGVNTYIQPRVSQSVTAAGSYVQGAYVVVAGVPNSVEFEVNGHPVTARWNRFNSLLNEPGNPNGELPQQLAGFSGRIAVIGAYNDLASVKPMALTLPIAEAVKAITPAGWSGSAEKSVNIEKVTFLQTQVGTNWMQALDGILAKEDLYANVDFTTHHISLRSDPQKSVLVDNEQHGVMNSMASPQVDPHPIPPIQGTSALTQSKASRSEISLASIAGITSIHDDGDSRIALCSNGRPTGLAVDDVQGGNISLHWDSDSSCTLFKRVDRFTVSSPAGKVDVARVVGANYSFPVPNSAGLVRVYEDQTSTYLVFSAPPRSIHVIDDLGMDNGELRDRFYKYNGKPAHLNVIVDGHQVELSRSPAVRFFEKPHNT